MMIIDRNKEDKILNSLTAMILSRKMSSYSLYFETINSFEKYIILKNKDVIIYLLKQNKWDRGLKYFNTFLQIDETN